MLTPLTDRVLIKPDTPTDLSDAGLVMVRDYVPENSGTVVAVPERTAHHCPECGVKVFAPPSVQVGDTVLFGYDAGQEVMVDAERFLLIRDADLIAVYATDKEEVTHV